VVFSSAGTEPFLEDRPGAVWFLWFASLPDAALAVQSARGFDRNFLGSAVARTPRLLSGPLARQDPMRLSRLFALNS